GHAIGHRQIGRVDEPSESVVALGNTQEVKVDGHHLVGLTSPQERSNALYSCLSVDSVDQSSAKIEARPAQGRLRTTRLLSSQLFEYLNQCFGSHVSGKLLLPASPSRHAQQRGLLGRGVGQAVDGRLRTCCLAGMSRSSSKCPVRGG